MQRWQVIKNSNIPVFAGSARRGTGLVCAAIQQVVPYAVTWTAGTVSESKKP